LAQAIGAIFQTTAVRIRPIYGILMIYLRVISVLDVRDAIDLALRAANVASSEDAVVGAADAGCHIPVAVAARP